ncbi:MAG: S-layer homology domain-containing protein, partial [Tepidanaerobacteraceae bacterium]
MRGKLISFLMILALLLPSFAFAAGLTVDYEVDGARVSVIVRGESYKPVSIVIGDGSRKHYIDQKETDASGQAVFNTYLEQGNEYECTVNLDGINQTKTIVVEKEEPEEPEQPEKPAVAYIYIKGYEGVILPKTEVEIKKGDTVLSITRRVLDSKGIDFRIRSGYVVGIDGQNEFDKGPTSGWMFSVNGDFPGIGPGSVTVEDGDYIQWLYTTNLGEDIGNIYEEPRKEIIDDALALLDDKNASEKEIIDMVKNITDYIVDMVNSVKSKDDIKKAVLRDLKDVNDIFLKVLARLKSEDAINSASANSARVAEMAARLLGYTDEEASITEISSVVKESIGITLAFVNKMSDESKMEKIIDDILDVALELNKKLHQIQSDNLQPEQRFYAAIPQENEENAEINLPGIFIGKATEKGFKKLDISSGILTAVLPVESLNDIHEKQGLKITAKKADKEALPESLQDQIPDGSILIEITEASGQRFSHPIEVGIPFEGKYNDETAVTVFWLKEDGSVQAVGGIYDPASKTARFFTTHFSTYFAKESVADFEDTKDHWARKEIGALAGKGIIKGKSEGIFDPDANITRAEFVALMTRAMGYGENHGYTVPFMDVRENDWYYNPIAIAYNEGLVNGKSATEFDPNGKITRQEMAKIISNIMKDKFHSQEKVDNLKAFKDFEEIASWARESAALCLREKIIGGISEGVFAPLENATRAQAAT